jgi:alcohol dehydrogenase
MKTTAAVIYEMEKPAPYAKSRPLQVEELQLEGPGPGEVLVEVAAAGLCHSDLSVINGSRPRNMPMVLGHEASGIVRDVGADVAEFKSGDAVVFSYVPICGHCHCCSVGRASLCENGLKSNVAGTLLRGSRRFKSSAGKELHHHLGVSGFSKYTVAAQESLVKLERDVPLDKAALFGCAVMTGVGAVVNTAKVPSGSSAAVFGLGGVGLSAIMGLKAIGAWPIVAVDRVADKLKLAQTLGATHVINAGEGDAVAALRDLTHGGAQYVFEAVGNEKVLAQAYSATLRGGVTVTIGLPHPSRQLTISAVSLVAEERTLMGSYMGSAVPRRDVPRYINMYLAGLLPVDKLFSRYVGLNEINEAFDHLASGQTVRQMVKFTE